MPLIGSLEILSPATTGGNLGAQTQHGVAIGEGPNVPLNWVVLSAGQLLVGNNNADPTPSDLIAGHGITITNTPGTITITGNDLGLQTEHGVAIGEGPNTPLDWVVLSAGQLLVGNNNADPTPSTLIQGSGISITNVPGMIIISNTGGGSSYPWLPAAGTLTIMENTGYFITGPGPATLSMPATSGVGDITEIVGDGAMWTLNANGNTIHFIDQTVSGSGSLQSTTNYDTIAMLCVGTNTFVVKSSEGNITINP